MQKLNKDNSKREKGAKAKYKKMLKNYLPQYNTGQTDTKEIYKS